MMYEIGMEFSRTDWVGWTLALSALVYSVIDLSGNIYVAVFTAQCIEDDFAFEIERSATVGSVQQVSLLRNNPHLRRLA